MKTSSLFVLGLLTFFSFSAVSSVYAEPATPEIQKQIDAIKAEGKLKHEQNKATMKQHHKKVQAIHENYKKQADTLRKNREAALTAGNQDQAAELQKQIDALKEERHETMKGPRADMRAHKERMRVERKSFDAKIKAIRKDKKN